MTAAAESRVKPSPLLVALQRGTSNPRKFARKLAARTDKKTCNIN